VSSNDIPTFNITGPYAAGFPLIPDSFFINLCRRLAWNVIPKDKKRLETAIAEFRRALKGWIELQDESMRAMTTQSITFYEEQLDQIVKLEQSQLVIGTSHQIVIKSIAISFDNRILATGGGEGTIKLWEIASGRQIRTLPGHQPDAVGGIPVDFEDPLLSVFEQVNSRSRTRSTDTLAFSPDGKFLASGGKSKTIVIWDVETGLPVNIIRVPFNVWFVAFNKDGKILLSKSAYLKEENRFRFYDVASGTELKENIPPLSNFSLPWQSADSRWTAEYDDHDSNIGITTTKGDSGKFLLAGHEGGIRKAAFNPVNNSQLASGGWDRELRLWDLENRKSIVFGKTRLFYFCGRVFP
jgi:WD40 repeat protein